MCLLIRFSIKDWLLTVALLGLIATCWQQYETARWVRFTAADMRHSAVQIELGDHSHDHIAETMRVYANWLEWAIGDRADSDASEEVRVHQGRAF